MTGNSVGEPEGTNWQYRYFLKVIDGGGFGCRNLEDLAFQLKITGTTAPRSPGLFRTLLAGNFISAGR